MVLRFCSRQRRYSFLLGLFHSFQLLLDCFDPVNFFQGFLGRFSSAFLDHSNPFQFSATQAFFSRSVLRVCLCSRCICFLSILLEHQCFVGHSVQFGAQCIAFKQNKPLN